MNTESLVVKGSRRGTRSLPRFLAVGLVLLAGLITADRGSAQQPRYTVEDIETAIGGRIEPDRILARAQTLGIAFTLDEAIVARLRAAGAAVGVDVQALIDGLRRMSRPTGPMEYAELLRSVESRLASDTILADVRSRGLAFQLGEPELNRLRTMGADTVLIAGLRVTAGLQPPRVAAAPPSQPNRPAEPPASQPARPADPPPPPRTKEEIRQQVYYNNDRVFRLSVGQPAFDWVLSGGRFRFPDAVAVGVWLGSGRSGWGVEFEHMRNRGGSTPGFAQYQLGVSFDPYIPIGETRLRLIVGATASGFYYSQRGVSQPSGAEGPSVRMLGGNADGRAGLAFHPSPRFFVFGDANYRYGMAGAQWVTDDQGFSQNEFWPDLSTGIRGWTWRFGIGM